MTVIRSVKILGLISLAFFLQVQTAYANVIWPGLYLEFRLLASWLIPISLAVEYLFVRKLTGFGVLRSVMTDFSMNLFSALIGFFLIPVAGFLFEIIPGMLLHPFLGVGLYQWSMILLTALGAVLVNGFCEWLVIRSCKIRLGWAGFRWLCVANAITVTLALASFWWEARSV